MSIKALEGARVTHRAFYEKQRMGLPRKTEQEKNKLLRQAFRLFAKATTLRQKGCTAQAKNFLHLSGGLSRIAGSLIKYADEDPAARSAVRVTIDVLAMERDTSRRALQLARALVRGPFGARIFDRPRHLPTQDDVLRLARVMRDCRAFGGDDRMIFGAACDLVKITETKSALNEEAQFLVRSLVPVFEARGAKGARLAFAGERTIAASLGANQMRRVALTL